MSHGTLNNFLHLRSDLLLDVLLQTSQHERLEDQMETFELMLVEFTLVHGVVLDVL